MGGTKMNIQYMENCIIVINYGQLQRGSPKKMANFHSPSLILFWNLKLLWKAANFFSFWAWFSLENAVTFIFYVTLLFLKLFYDSIYTEMTIAPGSTLNIHQPGLALPSIWVDVTLPSQNIFPVPPSKSWPLHVIFFISLSAT